jgi:purine-binding chemotaxis protein CheW
MRNKTRYAIDLMPNDPKSQSTLDERAKRLAQVEIHETKAKENIEYIRFKLGDHEYYGIPYDSAKEVMQKITITPVPHAPDYIAGIINRRGMLLTVLDIKKYFQNGLPKSEYGMNSIVIIVYSMGLTVGILVDGIEASDAYDPETINATLPTATSIKAEYILGLHKGKTAIINIDAIFSNLKSQLRV